jgi:hypothetical protein
MRNAQRRTSLWMKSAMDEVSGDANKGLLLTRIHLRRLTSNSIIATPNRLLFAPRRISKLSENWCNYLPSSR